MTEQTRAAVDFEEAVKAVERTQWHMQLRVQEIERTTDVATFATAGIKVVFRAEVAKIERYMDHSHD
jgi:hypothetical protein